MRTAVFLFVVALSSLPYMMVMSTVLADVQITTDKQIYSASDTVLVSMRSAGYIFRRGIQHFEIGKFQRDTSFDSTSAIMPADRVDIIVSYRPQIALWKKKAYHSLYVVEAQPKPFDTSQPLQADR